MVGRARSCNEIDEAEKGSIAGTRVARAGTMPPCLDASMPGSLHARHRRPLQGAFGASLSGVCRVFVEHTSGSSASRATDGGRDERSWREYRTALGVGRDGGNSWRQL